MHKWIDHIVVRVSDLDRSLEDYETKLGLKAEAPPEEEPHLGLRRAILPLGAIARSLEKNGEGLHLVALAVDDLEAAKTQMAENGARLIEATGMVFVHPSDGHGVLYQLIERE